MRLRPFAVCRLLIIILVSLCLFFITVLASAQDEQPAPQFLYRSENHLILLNGYTGESTELPFDVTNQDAFAWSPDGQYLLALMHDGACLNLYDVDVLAWVYHEPISCGVAQGAAFSADGTRIVYSSADGYDEVLWLYNLADHTSHELYRTGGGSELYPTGISDIQWSPTESYLTFVRNVWIMGGTRNTLIVMNAENHNLFAISGATPYYAHYDPIWSADDGWFLITLKEQYVTSAAIPRTNHQGDVYLVNTETGDQYRLTYTPAAAEVDVRWTDDGNIAFTVVTEEAFTFTPEQAMNVEVVPSEAMVRPEPIDPEDFRPNSLWNVIIAPDPNIGAWVEDTSVQSVEQTYTLNIGGIYSRTADISVPIQSRYDLIGWRPSAYPYPLG